MLNIKLNMLFHFNCAIGSRTLFMLTSPHSCTYSDLLWSEFSCSWSRPEETPAHHPDAAVPQQTHDLGSVLLASILRPQSNLREKQMLISTCLFTNTSCIRATIKHSHVVLLLCWSPAAGFHPSKVKKQHLIQKYTLSKPHLSERILWSDWSDGPSLIWLVSLLMARLSSDLSDGHTQFLLVIWHYFVWLVRWLFCDLIGQTALFCSDWSDRSDLIGHITVIWLVR